MSNPSIPENLNREEAAVRAGVVRDITYTVHLDLTTGARTFGSTSRIAFAANPGAATFLDVTATRITRATLNGVDIPTTAMAPTRITLDGLAADNVVEVEAVMAYLHSGAGMHRFVDPVDDRIYLHSQCEPFDAHRIYACFDQPDLKARFTFSADAPEEWVVVSNAPVATRPEEGAAGRWTFVESDVMSPYVTAVVAGSYHEVRDRHGDIDLGIYTRRSMAQYVDLEDILLITKQGFDFFGELFDYPYMFGKYDQLFVPEFSAGAMENPGCVTFNEQHIHRSRVPESAREGRADTILHEMAHMWFGDLVTMRWWDDLWLNESFATFMANHAMTNATRFTDAWVTFSDRWKAWARLEDQQPTTHPIAADTPDIVAVHQNFDGITYAKGASVLRQLVAWVGEEEFLAGCRTYFRRYAFGNASLSDFLAELEAASGRDLEAWSREWLETAGVNTLQARFEVEDGQYARFAIEQTAPYEYPTLRSHRIGVGLYSMDDGRLTLRTRVEIDIAGAVSEVPKLVGEAVADLVMVNDGDLAFAKLALDVASLETVIAHLADIDDPLTRTLCWGAAWDMLRDAELSATQFVALVHSNVHGVGDVGVLQTSLTRALSAALRFGDPARRSVALAGLTAFAESAARAAEPGSDAQLAWVRHWVLCARTSDETAPLLALLDGSAPLDGLAVDTDLRWHLITSLAARGAVQPSAIDAELQRDATELGRRGALQARAARPDAEAKATAWQAATTDTDLSHTLAEAHVRGFNQLDHEELLAPYVDRYFDVLPQLFAERDLDIAIDLAQGLFPHAATGEELLLRTDATIETADRPLRRMLMEQRDLMLRTLAGRELDRS